MKTDVMEVNCFKFFIFREGHGDHILNERFLKNYESMLIHCSTIQSELQQKETQKKILKIWYQGIIALSFYFHVKIGHSYSVTDGWSAGNFVKHVKVAFVQVLSLCSFICMAQTQNLDKSNFDTFNIILTKLPTEQPSVTEYERPMYHMKVKLLCFHSLISISYLFFKTHTVDVLTVILQPLPN